MNAYMACCCDTVPCGEQNCPRGGLFICGTYTVSLSGQEDLVFDGETCCGLARNRQKERQTKADTYCQFGFKVLLTNGSFGGPDFTNFDYPGRYSAVYVHNGRLYEREYSDNSGCPNGGGDENETADEEVVATDDREDTFVSSVEMSYRTTFFDCNDPTTFTQDQCLHEVEGDSFCAKVLDFRFVATRLAELAKSGFERLIQNGQVLVDFNYNDVSEVSHSLDWRARFYEIIDGSSQCSETLPIGPSFDYHSMFPCVSSGAGNCVCNYTENNDQCWGVNGYGFFPPPEPTQSFPIGGTPGPEHRVRFYEPCTVLGFGNQDAKAFDSSASASEDCFGVSECNDTPSENPDGLTISQTYNNDGQLEYRLQFSKWQFIPFEDLPPIQDPNWDAGLSCV